MVAITQIRLIRSGCSQLACNAPQPCYVPTKYRLYFGLRIIKQVKKNNNQSQIKGIKQDCCYHFGFLTLNIMTKEELKEQIIGAILESTDLDDNSVSLTMVDMYLDDILEKFIDSYQAE